MPQVFKESSRPNRNWGIAIISILLVVVIIADFYAKRYHSAKITATVIAKERITDRDGKIDYYLILKYPDSSMDKEPCYYDLYYKTKPGDQVSRTVYITD